jgi:hypothetical protein
MCVHGFGIFDVAVSHKLFLKRIQRLVRKAVRLQDAPGVFDIEFLELLRQNGLKPRQLRKRGTGIRQLHARIDPLNFGFRGHKKLQIPTGSRLGQQPLQGPFVGLFQFETVQVALGVQGLHAGAMRRHRSIHGGLGHGMKG